MGGAYCIISSYWNVFNDHRTSECGFPRRSCNLDCAWVRDEGVIDRERLGVKDGLDETVVPPITP